MVEQGIVPTQFGGSYEFVDVSAKARTNLDDLLETILLVADVEELKGDPVGRARGVVLEAHLDEGRGPVATVLVNGGTLDVGDTLVSGTSWAKIRAMLDENGQQVKQAGPSKPVQILGWSTTPNAGDEVREVEDERGRGVVQEREAGSAPPSSSPRAPPTLQELMAQAQRDEVPELNLIVKADVQGSIGALTSTRSRSCRKDEVRVNVIRSAASAITENATSISPSTSSAIVIGFNVRPDAQARELAEEASTSDCTG